MTQGTSVLILLSADAPVEAVAKAFNEQGVELIRSDLSVQDQDRQRGAFGDTAEP